MGKIIFFYESFNGLIWKKKGFFKSILNFVEGINYGVFHYNEIGTILKLRTLFYFGRSTLIIGSLEVFF